MHPPSRGNRDLGETIGNPVFVLAKNLRSRPRGVGCGMTRSDEGLRADWLREHHGGSGAIVRFGRIWAARTDERVPLTDIDSIYLYTCWSKSGGCISFDIIFY